MNGTSTLSSDTVDCHKDAGDIGEYIGVTGSWVAGDTGDGTAENRRGAGTGRGRTSSADLLASLSTLSPRQSLPCGGTCSVADGRGAGRGAGTGALAAIVARRGWGPDPATSMRAALSAATLPYAGGGGGGVNVGAFMPYRAAAPPGSTSAIHCAASR